MGRETIGCPICSETFTSVISFKKHLFSAPHGKQYKNVYPIDEFKRNKSSYTPHIFIMDKTYIPDYSRPILGLSQMTLCFCSQERISFYLCHVCEQKFHINNAIFHLSHVNHYSNYFAHTDPNALSFLSTPAETNLPNPLLDNIKKVHMRMGNGQLQVLHLPERLFKECSDRNYCQVMFFLYQNKSLSNMFKERKLEGMSIQTFKDDSNRMHPLIGLEYIVECICTPHTHLRTYLCTLCRLQLSSSMIIRHLLSFDHVFTYTSMCFPSALKEKECYGKDSAHFATLADFAKKAEGLHGPQEIQQVKLETSQILFVLNSCFKQALGKIESIANKGSLIPTVKPELKLEPNLPGSSEQTTIGKQESTSEPGTSENTILTQNIKEEKEDCTIEHSATPAAPSYSFHCQNCNKNFETNTLYVEHLSTCEHLENLIKTFGADNVDKSSECKPHFHSYKYFTEPDILCVGVSLVLTILSHQLNDEPVHLCFACETVFSSQDLKRHMNSERHLIQFLMYQNPWKLPFAWKTRVDYPTLKLKACAEEEKGPIKNIKILDVPPCLFPCGNLLSFSNVMEKLSQHYPLLMNEVAQRMHSKLQDNDRFPILGRDFLVKYGQTKTGWKFLCLLCQRSLSADDYTGHVFSWEHVVAFLEKFHPGTLDLNTKNEETLLDFAKQAARIHCISNAQVIEVDMTTTHHSLVMMDHSKKVRLLTMEKERNGKGPLMPSIAPKMKLFPKQQTQQKDLSLAIKPANPEINPENPVEKLDGFQSTKQVSHEPMDISLQEMNNLPTEQELKNNPMIPSEPNQSEEIRGAKNGSINCEAMMNTAAASKKQRRESDMDTSDSEMESLKPKRMRLSNPNDKESRPNLQNVDTAEQCRSSDTAAETSGPCYGSDLLSYVKQKIRNPVIGLSAVYECIFNDFPPIYLCECCHLKFKSQHITKHLSETWHYVSYIQSAGEDTPPNGKYWRHNVANLAVYRERREGCGETRVVKVMKEEYDCIEKASTYYEALKFVKKFLARKALHENSAKAATTNGQETSQQAMKMEIDPPSDATSSNTGTILTQTSDQQATEHATVTDRVSQSLGNTVAITSATPALLSSSFSSDAKSLTLDESESTSVEDTNLKMEMTTHTGALNSSKPLCKFIKKSVIPELESKPVDPPENATDEIQYKPASYITVTPKSTIKPVCKFMPAKSAKNKSTSAMSHLSATTTPVSTCNADPVTPDTQETASPLLVDKVTSRSPTSDVMKESSNPQDGSVQLGAVLGKAEPTCLTDIKTTETTESSSSQTKLPSAAPTPKTSDTQPKSTEIQLKLNVNAASHVKSDQSALPSGSLSPTTPNSGLLMPTAETSQKASPQTPQVGLDQLVVVQCKEKRLVYCLVCLTPLKGSNHLTTLTHQINSVKMKFPWWSAKPGEEELSKMVALLRDNEKALKVEAERIEVPQDIYKDLKLLPVDKAIEKIKVMVKRKKSKKTVHRQPSASTSEASNSLCDISTTPNISVSSQASTSSDLGNEKCQTNPQIKTSAQPLKKISVPVTPAPSPSPPNQKPTSKVAPRVIKGSTTDGLSNLHHILQVKNTPVIGLCLVWECRVMPPQQRTVYLCESCSVTISGSDICGHMKSTNHHFKYLMRQYPWFMYWTEEKIAPWMSDDLTDSIANSVKGREESMDAQTVLLSEEWFKWVQTAPFVEALNVVQMIKQEKKTTSLPPSVTLQQEVEPREQQETQPTMDTNTLTDLPYKTEMSAMEKADGIVETQHEASSKGNIACENTELCASATDTNCMSSPQITQLLDSQCDNAASTYSPQQPDEPTYSATEQNFVASPKDENQEHFELGIKACSESEITSPLSLNLAAMSPLVDTIETTSLEIITDASTDSKPKSDIQLCSPSVQETSAVSPNHLEDGDTEVTDEDQMMEESSCPGPSDTNVESTSLMASSKVDQNTNECPARESEDKTNKEKAALDQHYYLMLINLLKQTKNSMQQATSTSNQSFEPCTAKKPESNVELREAPQHTGWDIGQSPKTDIDATDNVYNIVTKNKSGSSAELQIKNSVCTGASNTEQPTFFDVIPFLNDDETTTSELPIQSQVQIVQPKDDEPVEESKVLKQLELAQEKDAKIQESETEKPLEIQVKQTEIQCSSAVHSQIESQCPVSQKKQELQLKSDTQNTSSKPFTHTLHDLMKRVRLARKPVKLQTQQAQVQVLQQTQNQELQVQPQVSQSQNAIQQTQSQKEQGQLNIAEVQQHTQQYQEQLQSGVAQVLPLQPQTQVAPTQHVTQQTQGDTEAVPIYSLITPRRQNAMRVRNDVDDRFQAALPSFVATPSVTSSSMVVTGDNGQYAQTAYSTNAYFSNSQSLLGVPQGSAYPSHIYHQQQTQQHDPFVQPFFQNSQHSGVFGSFAPNTQQTPVAQNYSTWYNGPVGGTSNMTYSNAVSFSTVNNQSYSYHSVQEYNRLIVQNHFYPFSMPPQTNSEFFPHGP